MRDRSFRDARQAKQPVAPAHDRGHDGAPLQGESAEGLRSPRPKVRRLPRPDTATSEDLRRFQLHLATQQTGAPTINSAIAALRFFFNVTLERTDHAPHLTTVHKPSRAPVV